MITVKTLAKVMLSFGAASNKKLQKLCYYAYAWYMALYREQLSPVRFEAWVHGPVSRELYNCYKEYGWDEIPQYRGFVMADNRTIAFCGVIWELYGKYTADELERMTHKELPWKNARTGYGPYDSSDEQLHDEDILFYYSNKLKSESQYRIAFSRLEEDYK